MATRSRRHRLHPRRTTRGRRTSGARRAGGSWTSSLVTLALTLAAVSVPNVVEGGRAHAAARAPLPLDAPDVVLQRHPEGCGAALLATLLRRHGLPGSEAGLLAAAPPGPNGISLARFAGLARARGLSGTWRRARPGTLPPPGFVAHLARPEGHFVWVADRAGAYLRVVDPASGEAIWHRDRFERRWSGRYLPLEATA
jgi:hypothetical protein